MFESPTWGEGGKFIVYSEYDHFIFLNGIKWMSWEGLVLLLGIAQAIVYC